MTHFGPEYARFMEGGSSSMGSNITLTLQPPKSTYLHVNYLSILQALQACQWDSVGDTRNDVNLLADVKIAFPMLCPMKLKSAFLILQG